MVFPVEKPFKCWKSTLQVNPPLNIFEMRFIKFHLTHGFRIDFIYWENCWHLRLYKQYSLRQRWTTMENGLHGKFDILVEAQALALALALAHRYGKIYKLFARPTHLFHVLESRESSISPSQATRTRFSKAFPNSVPIHHTKHLGNDSLYILLRFPMKIKLLIHFGVFLRADNSFESATVRWKNVSYQSSPIYLFICWYTSCLFCVNLNQCAMLVQILFSSFFPHSSFELTRLL